MLLMLEQDSFLYVACMQDDNNHIIENSIYCVIGKYILFQIILIMFDLRLLNLAI